jgi:hypothetical protein
LNKKCRGKTNISLVFIISFWDVFSLFDLCKLYHSLHMLICILRWLKMPHLKTFLGPVACHFTRKGRFSRQTKVSQHATIVKLCVIRRLNYHLPCSQPCNMAPTYQSFGKTCLYFRVLISPKVYNF